NIARVLQQDIAALVPAEVVLANASSRAKQAQFRVSVSILDFYVDAQNQARLTAQWHIVRGENTVASKQTAYRMSALSDDYSVRVEALNTCLQRLSRDLAAALRQVVAQN
ncbi:MAG: ABC-type transport auxiliary lipoprotein family protein, partial [Methylococcaceae bacterium]